MVPPPLAAATSKASRNVTSVQLGAVPSPTMIGAADMARGGSASSASSTRDHAMRILTVAMGISSVRASCGPAALAPDPALSRAEHKTSGLFLGSRVVPPRVSGWPLPPACPDRGARARAGTRIRPLARRPRPSGRRIRVSTNRRTWSGSRNSGHRPYLLGNHPQVAGRIPAAARSVLTVDDNLLTGQTAARDPCVRLADVLLIATVL